MRILGILKSIFVIVSSGVDNDDLKARVRFNQICIFKLLAGIGLTVHDCIH